MVIRRLTIVLLLFYFVTPAESKEPNQKQSGMAKSAGIPSSSLANSNFISAWYVNNGVHEQHPMTGNSGLTYPRGTATAIFTSGLIFGAYSNDGAMPANQPRISGSSYNTNFTPGAIIGIRTGVTEEPTAVDVRIWRIRRDYAVTDLRMDAAEYNNIPVSAVTDDNIAFLRGQYKKDWQEWPAAKGAPFYDANNDGVYTPQFEMVGGKEVPKLYPHADEPGIANADQVIWYVANDIRGGNSVWQTNPIGLELQVTVWGYNNPGVAGNILFKKLKLIYKGTALTPENGVLTNAYICHWSDPDLGDYRDDFVGCDTSLSLGYVYNSSTVDGQYKNFNLAPPAVGYDFLQGPAVPSPSDTAIIDLKKRPGYKNLPMTSFVYFAAGGMYSDPPFSLNGSWQWYSMLQGFPPTPQPPPFPKRIIDPVSGDSTFFWLNGDPIRRTGWIDGIWEPPGDRRMLQSSGPFTMALGDTQEIVVGVVGGIADNYLASIAAMKENDRTVQAMYNSLFTLTPPTVTAKVTYPDAMATVEIKAVAAPGQFTVLTAGIAGNSLQLFDDGAHNDGSAGDGIFANSIAINRSQTPVPIDVTMKKIDNSLYTVSNMVERVTIAGPLALENVTIHFDNINNDKIVNNGEYVRFGVDIKNNTAFNLKNVKAGFFSPIDFNIERPYGDIAAGTAGNLPYNAADENTFFSFKVPMDYNDPTYPAKFIVVDDNGNYWLLPYNIAVTKQSFISDSTKYVATNIVGKNDGQVGFVLFNPAMAGEVFDIWYGGYLANRNWTVVKNIPTSDYAAVTATMKATNQVPPINNLPIASGSGTFTINDSKTTVQYSVSVSGLTGAITGSHIHLGAAGTTGPVVHPITFSGSSAVGSWSIPDSLVDDFTAGNLYVNIHTAAHSNGEIRGQIADGLVERQALPMVKIPSPRLFEFTENRLVGFSLYVGPALVGVKSAQQISPTAGNVLFSPNPENSYRIVTFSPQSNFSGNKPTVSNLEIRFNNEVNWGMVIPAITSPIPSQVYFIKIPFAAYLDTTRVWPVIYNSNPADSSWSIDINPQFDGKPTFDRIQGIVDVKDASNNDISYYAPTNTVFPPTSNAVKGRILNGANHVYKDIIFLNEQGNGIPPASGTIVRFDQYQPIQIGDIKSITLQPLGVQIEKLSSIPHDYSLFQNFPNPFNPATTIEFALPRQSDVTITIYDLIGREVATLVNEVKSQGRYSVEWNGRNMFNQPVSSGIYFYQLKAGQFVQSRKMVLLK